MKLKIAISTIILSTIALNSHAQDAAAGKVIAASKCASCHGANGISASPMWPNLAGQKALYLEKQIKNFRDKKRTDPVMSTMAAGLSDADAKNIAAYYASLK